MQQAEYHTPYSDFRFANLTSLSLQPIVVTAAITMDIRQTNQWLLGHN